MVGSRFSNHTDFGSRCRNGRWLMRTSTPQSHHGFFFFPRRSLAVRRPRTPTRKHLSSLVSSQSSLTPKSAADSRHSDSPIRQDVMQVSPPSHTQAGLFGNSLSKEIVRCLGKSDLKSGVSRRLFGFSVSPELDVSARRASYRRRSDRRFKIPVSRNSFLRPGQFRRMTGGCTAGSDGNSGQFSE